MKTTQPYTYMVELAYDCPYCGKTQGWTETGYDEEDYKETKFCSLCRKEFKLEKKEAKQ